MPVTSPSHSFSAIAQPHTTSRIASPTLRHSGPMLCFDCLPATNQSSDAAMPPSTQCLAAKSESVAMVKCDYRVDGGLCAMIVEKSRLRSKCSQRAWDFVSLAFESSGLGALKSLP